MSDEDRFQIHRIPISQIQSAIALTGVEFLISVSTPSARLQGTDPVMIAAMEAPVICPKSISPATSEFDAQSRVDNLYIKAIFLKSPLTSTTHNIPRVAVGDE